ncbi:MAG: proteasome protein [Actinobacteria bacterium 69-20]|jgi:hypothetical protein|nr:PAC2 family protein [Actinomycetota bacterium]OJV26584.1 MAG: proteasome protein [Actinobacteria bacterium 69-20]
MDGWYQTDGPDGPRFRGDPADLYEVDADIADELAGTNPVMIVALDGYVDAGSGVELVIKELTANLPRETVVRFDADGLIDYRSRRPGLTFESNSYTSYDTPHLVMQRLRDAAGTPFVLFTGPEPDLSWEKFCAAVQQVIDRLGIRLTISLMAIPMGVPHTRPTGMSVHATNPDLLPEATNWIGSIEVPGHVSGLLEYRLGQAGKPALGFAVHVPHYLARSEYPVAARRLIDAAADAGGLVLPSDDLDSAITSMQEQLTKQVAEHSEVAEVVHALEKQYDAFMAANPHGLLAEGGPLPTADELGAQFEAYLANQDGHES